MRWILAMLLGALAVEQLPAQSWGEPRRGPLIDVRVGRQSYYPPAVSYYGAQPFAAAPFAAAPAVYGSSCSGSYGSAGPQFYPFQYTAPPAGSAFALPAFQGSAAPFQCPPGYQCIPIR